MSWDTARGALKIADVALQACEVIEKLTGIGGAPAEVALQTIGAIIQSVKQGAAGQLKLEDVAAGLKQLTDQITANDAKADKALHDKFDTTPGNG